MRESLNMTNGGAHDLTQGRRPWLVPAVIFGIWTLFGLLNASQLLIGLRAEEFYVPYGPLLTWQMLSWYGWGLVTPVVLWLGRRIPVTRATWARSAATHFLFCLVIAALHTAFMIFLSKQLQPFGPERDPRSFGAIFVGRLTSQLHLSILIYGVILGVSYAIDYYTKFRERESRAAQLESQLAQAQLQALRMQLNPHFLFNTLNGIAGLVRDGSNKSAVQMIAGLSDLLRHSLETSGQQEVPLRQELEVLELYLDIQQMRFPDRLSVRMEIEPDTLDARVPNLILQPIVENAIRHGIAPRAAPGMVSVSARRNDSLLEIRVCDDGPGLRPDAQTSDGQGIGLSNTRERLTQLYGSGHRFDMRNRAEGGVEALIVIPFRS